MFNCLLHIIISYYYYYCLSLFTCTYPRDLSREAYCKYKSEISEHGAFPLVSVWVWHGEPGNVHPYNFEPISPAKTYILGIIIVRNPKTTDSRTVQHDYSMCWMIVE